MSKSNHLVFMAFTATQLIGYSFMLGVKTTAGAYPVFCKGRGRGVEVSSCPKSGWAKLEQIACY